ncbi:MAG: hypothetical protein LBJ64_00500, partial [Deltaproteobacteria bacterium]|nr:hypothetical protein [Deltaproteobacteria bacterium]
PSSPTAVRSETIYWLERRENDDDDEEKERELCGDDRHFQTVDDNRLAMIENQPKNGYAGEAARNERPGPMADVLDRLKKSVMLNWTFAGLGLFGRKRES